MKLRTIRLPALLVGALAVGLAPAAAAPKPKGTPSPYAAQIAELHQIKVLLERADRDYKGHRAAAVKEITAAIHDLQAGHRHGRGGPHVKGGGEPQALSDEQLREAVAGLKAVQAQLAGAPSAAAVKAAAAVEQAVKELNIALEIK